MRLVYVAGPYTAKTAWEIEQNIRRAEEWGLRVAECGAMPVIPHTNNRFFYGQCTAAFWYEGTLELLKRCDAIFLIPGWLNSSGSRKERTWAHVNGMPIFDTEGTHFEDDAPQIRGDAE